MIDLKKAEEQILESTPILERESVPILDAVGRVLARDITASEDLPASNISAMDGYAVPSSSVCGASKEKPVHLKIIGESPAGRPCSKILKKGQAVRIMTGGVVPEGADTVVRREHTREESGYVLCYRDTDPGTGIRFKGESLKKDQIVLRAGDRVTPMEVGALATLRRAHVYVHRKPLVAVLSPGDELSDFHEPPSPFKIMCSNLYVLAALIKDAGALPLYLGIVRDDLTALEALLKEALRADLIITSGGTSRGKYDLVHQAFASLGFKMKFSNILVKPGKPTIFGTLGKSLVFGLPGNPSATMLSFKQFIKPVLLKMTGHPRGCNGSQNSDDPFAPIDSFNYALGGNKGHLPGSQIPLTTPLPKNGRKLPGPAPMEMSRTFLKVHG
ncbi:gephyrin-like molybdotransferase Glp [Desulfospira joergensenii]|uniref:molybdopterin molybdotransferase MoeA n=1 Tax=Desulfospira joergensenii TaxID=53329 RepID=UPI000684104F|nr:gephyrin-like molybdotransferase Glp [Desulfospira joergensenii]